MTRSGRSWDADGKDEKGERDDESKRRAASSPRTERAAPVRWSSCPARNVADAWLSREAWRRGSIQRGECIAMLGRVDRAFGIHAERLGKARICSCTEEKREAMSRAHDRRNHASKSAPRASPRALGGTTDSLSTLERSCATLPEPKAQ
jgi:hypothetical protein